MHTAKPGVTLNKQGTLHGRGAPPPCMQLRNVCIPAQGVQSITPMTVFVQGAVHNILATAL
eukprot:363211-Chlamydomonas_euryale.AAC.16